MMRLDTPHRDALASQIEQVVSARVNDLTPAVTAAEPGMSVTRVNYSSLGAAICGSAEPQVKNEAAA